MKDYKGFLEEAAGEGFGETPEGYKKAQQANKIIKDLTKNKQQTQERKPTPASGAKPDGIAQNTPGPGGSEFRRRQREKTRETILKNQRSRSREKFMNRAGNVYNTVKGAMNPNSQSVGTTGGSSSREAGVRYQ